MNHDFEQLGPERFQEFCQSLLLAQHPDLQCFPVGQADGGRDGVLRPGIEVQDLLVYQVKFTRNPATVRDPGKEVIAAFQGELEKIDGLARRGATRYVMITNLAGTAMLDRGSMDRVSEVLDSLSIPAMCLWRDDLDRRLDAYPQLRWSFPELLRGTDVLKLLLEEGFGEDEQRRRMAVNAFLVDQYEEDRTVQFKQVDLHSELLDLFVDVPCTFTASSRTRRYAATSALRLVRSQTAGRNLGDRDDVLRRPGGAMTDREDSSGIASYDSVGGNRDRFHFIKGDLSDREDDVGAATLLLDRTVQATYPFVCIEGAPGQGKSTLGQYVCQVHRIRLLNRDAERELLPEAHRTAPLRLPFKAELRDLVLWLKGDPACCPDRPGDWQASLSAFLAHQVWHQSGGHSFSVSDLQHVLMNSAVLLLLDGLDEIAEPEQRDRVVNEITRSVTRLRHNAKSLQVVVTSRPVAFINSAGLSEDLFQYAELRPVTLPLVKVFAERWSRAQKLRPKDLESLLSTLEAKLAEPHVRDLARNPMQLAILLTLLHTRGVALPDQRTALYDNYIDIFLDREAVKSEVVREHRGLLRDIHAYLGWELHSQAELGRTNGAISGEDLDKQLRAYLASKHQDPELSTELFGTAVLRVVAIVSRIQGTFEFEVQTLREYFAGRYLYETAPYAPVGQEKPGTKPERFEAIARNFYWLNVARFYAGCHTSGELPSLAEQICELAEIEANNPFAYTSHPQVLSGMLLFDWVFAQSPSSVMRLVDLTSGGVGLRHAWLRDGRAAPLPSKCGGEHLVERCWDMLEEYLDSGFAHDVSSVLLANLSADEFDRAWLARVEAAPRRRRARWLRIGRFTGALQRTDWRMLRELIVDQDGTPTGLEELIAAGQDEALREHPNWAGQALRGVLDGEMLVGQEVISGREPVPVSIVSLVRLVHEPRVWLSMTARSYTLHVVNKGLSTLLELDVQDEDQDLLLECHDVLQSFERHVRDQAEFFDDFDLTPLAKFLDESILNFGVRWIHLHLAAVSAGFAEGKGGRGLDLTDETVPLLDRARRAIGSDLVRWQRQLKGLVSPTDAWFALALLFAWSRPKLIVGVTDDVERLLSDLEPSAFTRLVHTVRMAKLQSESILVGVGSERRAVDLQPSDLPPIISCRFAAMLALRTSPASVALLYDRCGGISVEQAKDGLEHLALAGALGRIEGNRLPSWRHFLALVTSLYARDVPDPIGLLPDIVVDRIDMPLELARIVMSRAEEYPREIVLLADRRCREKARETIVPLATIAGHNSWFAEG